MAGDQLPFDTSGIGRGPDGIARYEGLPQNLATMLRDSVDRHPDRVAVAELGGRSLCYRELWGAAARVAGGLRDRGVGPGDRVANQLPNGVDWVLACWGTVLAGAVTVPVNTRFAPPEVEYVVTDSGAAVVVASGQSLPDGEPLATVDQAHTEDAPGFALVDTSSVRSLSYGGAPIAPDLVHRIQAAFPTARVGDGFGLSETASVSAYLPHESPADHADSVGFPAPVVDVRVADPDPATGVGELLIRGPNVRPATGPSPSRPPSRSSTAGCTAGTSPGSTSTAWCTWTTG